MTESELERLVVDRLAAVGIVGVLDRHLSQFLWVGEEFFVEVVLTDASRQADVVRLMKDIQAELARTGTALDPLVRSQWEVTEVHYFGASRSPEGGVMTASDFRVRLASGAMATEVRVDVSIAALSILRQKLGIGRFPLVGWSPAKGDLSEENISAAVQGYVETQLQQGGVSYWDPLLQDRLTLNEAAMSYFLGHSIAFQELHSAVTDAFSPSVRESFLESLRASKKRIEDFDRVLPELSNMLGGAYTRGQRLTYANELFNSLTQGERELLKGYFRARTKELSALEPRLVEQFHSVFAH